MANGPDISSHQHDSGAPLNFNAVKAADNQFVIVKATQNDGYKNPYFEQDVNAVRGAGLVAMPYHYMGPGSPTTQVANFLNSIRSVFPKGTLAWLDYEEHTDHNILHQMELTLDPTPFSPGVYTYPDWWANNGDPNCKLCARHPLWFADYNNPANRPAPSPWNVVSLRQTHGTSYSVPGLPGLNDYSHTEVDFNSLIRSHGVSDQNHTGPAGTPGWYVHPLDLHTPLFAGGDVKHVQEKIGMGNPDGIYGPKTKQWVLDWQRKHNLTPDGVVGPMTAKALG